MADILKLEAELAILERQEKQKQEHINIHYESLWKTHRRIAEIEKQLND